MEASDIFHALATAPQNEGDEDGDGGESGEESDGYGDEGLSWEAVMQGLQQPGAGDHDG